MSDRDLGCALLTIARSAIAAPLGFPHPDAVGHRALMRPAATFVTLRNAGVLRGCIGSIRPVRPLAVDVRENAAAAAFRDPRFPPLAAAEFDAVSVEVSLLSADERLAVVDENDLVARLRPGVDGVILEHGRHRATFLPQVWGTIPDPREFVAALKLKAGLPEGFWRASVNVSRYRVTKWTESELLASEAQR
jgi:AmmeMemoRadiSam system protein A